MDKRRLVYTICGSLLVILVAIGCFVVLKTTQSNEYNKQLSLGDKYLQELDYENAELCYQTAIQIDEKHVKPYVQLSNVYVAQGRYDDAVAILEQANAVLGEEYSQTIQLQMDQVEVSRNASIAFTETPVPTEEPTEETTEETQSVATRVEFNHTYELIEYAIIVGYDENGTNLWTYETGTYDAAQLDRVSEIGIYNGAYYFVEDGTIVTLNLADGSVIWKNAEFQGAAPCFDFGSKGVLYISGYFGPDLFVVDREGATIKRVDSFTNEYYWPSSVDEQDGEVRIEMDMGPNGDGDRHTIVVNVGDYSYYVE